MELISIILPVYNCEKYLERCVNSLISQTYKNIEIIIINDGSTDSSSHILKQKASVDSRIKIIDKKNDGVSAARNLGIEKSNGQYIMFVDADDWLEENAVEIMYESLVKNTVDVVRGNYYKNKNEDTNDSIGNLYRLEDTRYESNQIKRQIIDHFLFSKKSIPNLVMLLLIKKEKLKNIRFDESLYFMEDVVFYLELLTNVDNFYMMSKPIYHYYLNSESVTHSVDKYIRNIFGAIETNKKIRKIIINNDLEQENRISKINTRHLQIISDYFCFCIKDNVDIEQCIININKNIDYNDMRRNVDLKILSLKNKIMVYCLVNNKIKIFKIFSKLRGSLKKVKDKLRK